MDPLLIDNLTEVTRLDGVYIYELDPDKYVRGVGTGIAGCVGEFEWGPTDEIVPIGSSKKFSDTFGGYGTAPAGEELTWRGFSGYRAINGKRWPFGLRIVRPTATGMAKAAITFKIPSAAGYRTVTLTAKYNGARGNAIAGAFAAAGNTALTDGFKFTATLGVLVESYDNLYAAITVEALGERLQDSKIFTMTIGTEEVGAPDSIPASVAFAAGSDGTAALPAKWTAGIDMLAANREINVIFCAEPDGTYVTNAALNAHMKSTIAPATGATPFVIGVLAGDSAQSAAAAAADAADYRSDRLIYTWPYRYQSFSDAASIHPDGELLVPSNDAVACALVNTDPLFDPASARASKYLNACTVGLEYDDLTRDDYVTCNAAGVMGIEFDPDLGYKVINGVTTSLVPGKETVHRRRLADYFNKSLARALKFYQNEPITQEWKDDVRGAVQDFIEREKEAKPLQRILAAEVDTESVNDDTTEAQGIYNILMKIRHPASARAIVLLSQIGTSVEVRDGNDFEALA